MWLKEQCPSHTHLWKHGRYGPNGVEKALKSDWTKTAVVRYCSPFLSNTFTKSLFLVSAWVLCGSVPYSILCCGFVRLWSSLNYCVVLRRSSSVGAGWKGRRRPLGMTGKPCIHAQWERRGRRTSSHLCSVSLRLSLSQKGSSCWWLEA